MNPGLSAIFAAALWRLCWLRRRRVLFFLFSCPLLFFWQVAKKNATNDGWVRCGGGRRELTSGDAGRALPSSRVRRPSLASSPPVTFPRHTRSHSHCSHNPPLSFLIGWKSLAEPLVGVSLANSATRAGSRKSAAAAAYAPTVAVAHAWDDASVTEDAYAVVRDVPCTLGASCYTLGQRWRRANLASADKVAKKNAFLPRRRWHQERLEPVEEAANEPRRGFPGPSVTYAGFACALIRIAFRGFLCEYGSHVSGYGENWRVALIGFHLLATLTR
jgi:hypothetical protein